jgi:hypothetical protein
VQFSPLCFSNYGKFAIRAQGKMPRWSTRGLFIHVTLRCMALIWWTNCIWSKACSTFTPTAIWRKVLSKMSASFCTLGKVVRSSAKGDQIGPTLYVSPCIKGPHAYEVCPTQGALCYNLTPLHVQIYNKKMGPIPSDQQSKKNQHLWKDWFPTWDWWWELISVG